MKNSQVFQSRTAANSTAIRYSFLIWKKIMFFDFQKNKPFHKKIFSYIFQNYSYFGRILRQVSYFLVVDIFQIQNCAISQNALVN